MSDGEPKSKKPEDSDFQQQRLKAWQPLLTPKWVIGTFVLIGIVFIPIGIGIVVSSNQVVEVEHRYDNIDFSYPASCDRTPPNCQGQFRKPGEDGQGGCKLVGIDYEKSYSSPPQNVDNCSMDVKFKLDKDMDAPVYFYYKLSNYYQNHRRYVKSRSDTQLAGDKNPDLSTCDPWEHDEDGKTLYPCGLIAGSFFVDRFSATVTRDGEATPIVNGKWHQDSDDWQKSGIAWSSDKDDKFKHNEEMYTSDNYGHRGILGVKLPPVNDEDFIVWMRTAGLPTFKKLYRKINVDLKKGDEVTIRVLNYYPVSEFSGQKAFVLSTTSWLGGKNSFLGWCYIVVGIVCVVLAVAFLIKQLVAPRPLGDMRYFNWPANQQAK